MRSRLPHLFFVLILACVAFYLYRVRTSTPHRNTRPGPEHYREETHPGRGRLETSRHGRESPLTCSQFKVTCASKYFLSWHRPRNHTCSTLNRHGYPVPDPRCTPGGINPTVTSDVLENSGWRTGCIRDCSTSEADKHVTYRWYGLHAPRRNSGEHQVCELDHLVPLELGGADGLGNIWPQCGPSRTVLKDRYFKVKDRVENYLADEVKAGKMPLGEAQRGIAADWTQYLDAANRYCASGGRCE
jgi:hypothetical protein